MIATMEAVQSVPAIPEPAGFGSGEFGGYIEAAAGVLTPEYVEIIGALFAGCDAFADITGTAA